MTGLVKRMVRAARFDPALYREAAADRDAMGQAMVVVMLFAAAAGLGAYRQIGPLRAVPFAVIELVGWYAWAVLMYLIGTKLLPRPGLQPDLRTFLRAAGFSSAPGVLRILGLVPPAALPVDFVVLVWMLMAAIVAVKEVFQYTGIWQAVAVSVIAWVIVRIAQRLLFALI